MLPTDRFHFSSADGTVCRDIEKIRCPSMAWQWEGSWELELTHEGSALDHDGWTYALDFPATYYVEKHWKSYVRRRKWFRYRRYTALNSWCAVSALHKDATEEPFIDVCIGGTEIFGAQDGTLSVWAVTTNGRVVFRNGVSKVSPEGLRWTIIKTPPGSEVTQISVGCSGLVWCSLYNGRALARTGVTKDNISGDNWIEVKAPVPGSKIHCVAVGKNSVWCVSKENQVWWRKGIKGDICGVSEDAAVGSNWVEMVGNISFISVTNNDQVFGINSDDKSLYFRAGLVTDKNPTGKKWCKIQCPMQLSRTSSINSITSRNSENESPASKYKSLGNLLKENRENHVGRDMNETTSYSAPNQNQQYDANKSNQKYSYSLENEIETQPNSFRSVSPVRSVGSVVACEVHPDSDATLFEVEYSKDSGIFAEEDIDHFRGSTLSIDNNVWTTLTAGALTIDINQLPKWLNFDSFGSFSAMKYKESWRLDILQSLKMRQNTIRDTFQNYEKAIELSSWVKSGEAKISHGGKPYEECLIELEWVDDTVTSGSGTLTILSSDTITIKLQISLSEIMSVICCSEPNAPRLVLHTPRLSVEKAYITFQFNSDNELEDWLSYLSSSCCQIQNVSGKPSTKSVWATTFLGDVYAFDPSTLHNNQIMERESETLFLQINELAVTETPYLLSLYNGMTNGSILEISGYIFPEADQVRFDLQSYPTVKNRIKERNIALHINPRFNENTLVFNSMKQSLWQDEIRFNQLVLSPGSEFTLTIKSESEGFKITIDNTNFPLFHHRSDSGSIVSFYSSGRVKIFEVKYSSPSLILCPNELFWRQMGGHLKKVETCQSGIVLGISNDNVLYHYTGGYGGNFLKGLETNTSHIHPMTDTQNYYVYENQRWNPISGFSMSGLPTDRHW